MSKYLMVAVVAVVVLGSSLDAEARGRRSRGSCPNGQCYASIPAATTTAVAVNEAPEATVVEAPAVPATNQIAAATSSRTSFRSRGFRLFRRR